MNWISKMCVGTFFMKVNFASECFPLPIFFSKLFKDIFACVFEPFSILSRFYILSFIFILDARLCALNIIYYSSYLFMHVFPSFSTTQSVRSYLKLFRQVSVLVV
jgi:hypothetical protein